jgi:hypothetical protein
MEPSEIDDLGDLWILPSDANKRKSAKNPSEWFKDIDLTTLEMAVIDRNGLSYANYRRFIRTRRSIITERLRELTDLTEERFAFLARKELAELFPSVFDEALATEVEKWRWTTKTKICHYNAESEVEWWDRAWYNDKKDCGAYFAIMNLSDKSLGNNASKEDRPSLCLYYQGDGRAGNLEREALRASIQNSKIKLVDLDFSAHDGDSGYLVTQAVILTDEAQNDEAKLVDYLLTKSRMFHEAVEPIVAAEVSKG